MQIHEIVEEFDADDLSALHAALPQGKKSPIEVPEPGRGQGAGGRLVRIQRIQTGDELNIADLFFDQPAPYRGRAAGRLRREDGENVEIHPVSAQQLHRRVSARIAALSRRVGALRVVGARRSVQGQPDEDASLPKQGAVFVIQQQTVGLEGPVEPDVRQQLIGHTKEIPEKADPCQRRLAALKGDRQPVARRELRAQRTQKPPHSLPAHDPV